MNNQTIYKSSTGSIITHYFETSQGSQYLFTEKGESKRWKSDHKNTGGEDMGVKKWYPHCVFVNPDDDVNGNSYLLLRGKFKLSVGLEVKDTEACFWVLSEDKKSWRRATRKDSHPVWSVLNPEKSNMLLSFRVSKKPVIGWNTLEYKLENNFVVKNIHFGSPVSKIVEMKNITQDQIKNFLTSKK